MIDCNKLDGRRKEICIGYDVYGDQLQMDDRKRLQYLKLWLPEYSDQQIIDFLRSQKKEEDRIRGLGDVVAKAIKVATFGQVKPCNKCKERQEKLNRLFPFSGSSNVEKIELQDHCKKNLLMHIWPTNSNSAWKWNCDQIKKRKHLFNGSKIIAIAIGPNTEPQENVIDYMKDFADDFIIVNNNPKIREGASFTKLLERVQSKDEQEITFYCHAKGARHKGSFGDNGSTLHLWTETMYKICLDNWGLVKNSLNDHAMTGTFRRFGQFKTPGNNRWHYSGSFYWFRNKDVFSRNWRHLDNMFFCVESWPGYMFKPEEAGYLIFDKVEDLYLMDYWNSKIKLKLIEMGINNET